MIKRFIIVVSVILSLIAVPSAAFASSHWDHKMRVEALHWAKRQKGKPYIFGATGPHGFDCSGLVMESYLHGAGVKLPRTTFAMLDSHLLVRVRHPKEGDLAFYGAGHVELEDHKHWTWGAAHTGTFVGAHRISGFWQPTMYYRVR